MVERLTPHEIDTARKHLGEGWTLDGEALKRSYQLPSFMEAIAFVLAVAHRAEEMNHHPDIDIRWTTVNMRLTTHSVGGITDLDVALAERAEKIFRG